LFQEVLEHRVKEIVVISDSLPLVDKEVGGKAISRLEELFVVVV